MGKKVSVIICAAGSGTRFGGKQNKPLVDVAGRAAMIRSVELFCDRDDVVQVLVAVRADDEEMVKIKHGTKLGFYGAKMYVGGSERFETVAKGLELVSEDAELVAVHDAVRCCVTEKWIDDVFAKAGETGSAMLAAPVVATIKAVKDGVIEKTVDRTGLYEAQTPQVFDKKMLKDAYGKLETLDKSVISDDAQLVEAIGKKVSIVETDQSNIKITTKADVAIAEAILKSRPKPKAEGYQSPFYEAKW